MLVFAWLIENPDVSQNQYGQEMSYAGHSKINVFNILGDNIIDKEANEQKILNDFGNVWVLFELSEY